MPDTTLRFSTFDLADPDEAALRAGYEQVLASIEAAHDDSARIDGLAQWDAMRRTYASWRSLVSLRFQQNTGDARAKSRRQIADRLNAQVALRDADVKRSLLDATDANALEAETGAQVIDCWRADLEANAPELEPDMVEESRLVAKYVELLAGAEIPFRGETYSFTTLTPLTRSADRETREGAMRAACTWRAQNLEELDEIFDELVKLRAGMAAKVGLSDFVELGYRRMHRVDYDRKDVERFRDEVRRLVVPLATDLRAAQATKLGLDELMFWDESIQDPAGNPKPIGGTAELIERGRRVFHGVHPEIGTFFDGLVDREMLDLDVRGGKAGGGFCTFIDKLRSPFIFANCTGSQDDVRVLVHEAGHAFQMWSSRMLRFSDQIMPTYEACEIHSMALEFLAWPEMEQFFGDDADRYRRNHLADALTFLPYGVAVDHFQHLVYERPEATPAERHAMWQEMEALYLPSRKYGGMPHFADGALWQRQRHIYGMPFYYIDYTLAQTCALQMWARAFEDREGTLADYVALCKRGGTMSFQKLAASAGIISPFETGCLESVVTRAREWLTQNA